MAYVNTSAPYTKGGSVNENAKPANTYQKEQEGHQLILTGRTRGIISGVKEIEEFDNETIDLSTTMGRLLIKGKNLKVKGLDLTTGEARIEGNVDSLEYTKGHTEESLLKRLFR